MSHPDAMLSACAFFCRRLAVARRRDARHLLRSGCERRRAIMIAGQMSDGLRRHDLGSIPAVSAAGKAIA